MRVRLTRDLALPLANEGCEFWVSAVSTGRDGKKLYFVRYYGNDVAFPADACEEVEVREETI